MTGSRSTVAAIGDKLVSHGEKSMYCREEDIYVEQRKNDHIVNIYMYVY